MNLLKRAAMCIAFVVLTLASSAITAVACEPIVASASLDGKNTAICRLTAQSGTTCTYYCTCTGSCTTALKPWLG